VSIAQFGEVLDRPPAVEPLIGALPDVLAAADLRSVVERWAEAVRAERGVVVMCGGHVVKTGCSPFLADAVERGWITHLAFNGATAIHDFEIACFGETSEDVAENLADGTFGLADETGSWMAEAIAAGHAEALGCGEALGRWLASRTRPHARESLMAAWERGVRSPSTSRSGRDHHQHRQFDGGDGGDISRLPHREELHEGGWSRTWIGSHTTRSVRQGPQRGAPPVRS
jgi:hypothetical protein